MVSSAVTERPDVAPEITPVPEATIKEGYVMLDEAARYYLGITGKTFLRRWRNDFYAGDLDRPGVMSVAALLPFVQGRRDG